MVEKRVGHSIQAKGIEPDIKVLQEVPDDLKARTDAESPFALSVGPLAADFNERALIEDIQSVEYIELHGSK
jgi:C-terminal processing protease CtpA/Prc